MPTMMQVEVEDPQVEEEQQKKQRRSKRQKIMNDSGQTDRERRMLRNEQRSLQQEITGQGSKISEEMKDAQTGAFEKVRERNNELYNRVRYTREAVIDADNIDAISSRVTKQADKLIQAPTYDAHRLATAVRNHCTRGSGQSSRFCWKSLGLEIGPCFNAVPSHVNFLAGPIQEEFVVKERAKRERRKRNDDDAEEEEPEELEQKNKSKDKDKLSAVETTMKIIVKTLDRRCKENETEIGDLRKDIINRFVDEMGFSSTSELDKKSKKIIKSRVKKMKMEAIDLPQFVFNPESFTQTVENLVGLSHLVKKGDAAVGARSAEDVEGVSDILPPGPYVRSTTEEEKMETNIPSKQSVVVLNMRDWRRMCKDYRVEESDIPHRKGSKYAKTTAK